MEFKDLLLEEIETELESLRDLDVSTKEYKATVDGVTKLMDRAIEIRKLEIDIEEKERNHEDALNKMEFEQDLKREQAEDAKAMAEFDKNLRREQADDAKAMTEFNKKLQTEKAEFESSVKLKEMEEERKARLIGYIIDAAGIVLPIIITIWGTKKSFEFEREGTITTIMGRGFINKLIPRK